MIYQSDEMEQTGILQVAAQMCIAARTAPKGKGVDRICTMVLTGEEKEALAKKMEEIGERDFADKGEAWMCRDARNLRDSQAVVLVGTKLGYRGVAYCGFCGYANCGECKAADGRCAFDFIDLGIAVSSAVSIAADNRADSRIMVSIGKAAEEMNYLNETVLWQGIPISVTGKSIFFDRSN